MYSNLDGFSTPEEIAERCVALGLPGAFLTDHGLVAGHPAFAKAMQEKGLFAGYGVEAYQAAVSRFQKPEQIEYVNSEGKTKKKTPRDAAHLILLAQSAKGLENLNRLSDEANRTGYYFSPRLDWELLEKYNEGIICTSACLGGLVSKGIETDSREALDKYLEIFGDRFFIELHTYHSEKQRAVNKELWSIAQSIGIPVVFASDAHYANPDDYQIHELLLNMQYKSDISSPKHLDGNGEIDENHTHDGDCSCYHPQSLYIMGEDEVRQSLDYLPQKCVDEAIANSDLIAEMCKVELPETRMHMPTFHVTKHETEDWQNNKDLLWDLVVKGLEDRYEEVTDEIFERAEYEFDTITSVDLGDGATLGDYFLINKDWIDWCASNQILTGPGRGSVGGSILAYALGITHIDPLKYDLQFERFWNPGRASGFPDIDTDVEQGKRQVVKQYFIDTYGSDKVLSIGTQTTFRPKSAIEDVARAYFGRENMSWPIVDEIKAIIETTVDAGKQPDWPEVWEQVGGQLLPLKNKNHDWKNVFELAERVTGRISNYGVHASAVVVSDVELPTVMPCRSAKPPKGSDERPLVTQIDMHQVEEFGFLKLDALGLRNLDTLSRTARLAGLKDFNWWDIDWDSVPEECWQLIDNDLTLGLFQIEDGQAAKMIGRRIRPRSIEDLALIVALNRPGPLRSGMVERFIARRDGSAQSEYSHPILEDILEPTYGDFLYQEQVIAFFRKIGYSLSDADHIRKILGKKLVDKMNEEKPRYLENACKFMDLETAEKIWDDIIGFSKYSFNKAHAIGYALILAATMYAKWKWTTEFIMACIQTNSDKTGDYIQESRKMGVLVLPPDINMSEPEICVKDGNIYFGLSDVKHCGKGAARQICKLRKSCGQFESYDDFIEELHYFSAEWDELEVKIGRSPKQLCTQRAISALKDAGAFDSLDIEEDPVVRANLQRDLLGTIFVDLYSKILERNGPFLANIPTLDALKGESGLHERTFGLVSKITLKKTRADASPRYANKEYAIVELEWQGNTIRTMVFSGRWEKYKETLKENSACLVELEFNDRGSNLVAAQRL